MSKVQISEIIDSIYFQKLSTIISNLQDWSKKKHEMFNNVFGQAIIHSFLRMEKNEIQINNQTTEFIKILNIQYSFLSKLKREEKAVEISPIFKQFKQFSDNFIKKKQSLLELSEFLGKFIGVTNYQFTELKKVYDSMEQLKNRYENFKQKHIQIFNQRKDLIYSKKNVKKIFEMKKILQIISELQKQKIFYSQLSEKIFKQLEREIITKQKMFRNICDNLEFIDKLYSNNFKQQILQNIKQLYKNKYEKLKLYKEDLINYKINPSTIVNGYKQIQIEFYTYFDSFIDEITIANWHVTISKLKQNDVYEGSDKDLNLILTLDNKLIFYVKKDKDVYLENHLQDLKIYKPNAEGKFQVKNRKNKEKFFIKFMKIENQDEFFLHYQQKLSQKE